MEMHHAIEKTLLIPQVWHVIAVVAVVVTLLHHKKGPGSNPLGFIVWFFFLFVFFLWSLHLLIVSA